MAFSVVSKETLKRVKGKTEVKAKYVLTNNSEEICAVLWDSLNWNPIVYDKVYDEEFSKYNWGVLKVGYAFTGKYGFMHRIVVQRHQQIDTDLTVDHINCFKLDNRSRNLRIASQSEQNSNRPSRSDKQRPCHDLVQMGVQSLPKYVRWDKTEEKFVIENHPYLEAEVLSGIRKKACQSGSKSKKLNVVEKFQDILSRLQELDAKWVDKNKEKFDKLKLETSQEYLNIRESIQIYEGNKLPHVTGETSQAIIPRRQRVEGKKTVSHLPNNCGIIHSDLPKYCYYRGETDTRGDSFIIDRHPALVKEGKRTWSTTSSKLVPIHDKFNELIIKAAKLNEKSS
jgi:HNH endonuclease